jgi:hypothetical protein
MKAPGGVGILKRRSGYAAMLGGLKVSLSNYRLKLAARGRSVAE